MGWSWAVDYDPGVPTAEGLRWRWFHRRRAVRVDVETVATAAMALNVWADALETHIRDSSGVCGDCAAALAELRRLAADMEAW